MKLFYGCVIVGARIVVTCVGFGTMLSVSIFLQPMAGGHGLVAGGHLDDSRRLEGPLSDRLCN
jgi:ribosomal protein S5